MCYSSQKVMRFNFMVAYVIKVTHGGAENDINTWALGFCTKISYYKQCSYHVNRMDNC